MFIHYLKIAFRNMWKYKNQTLISVIGLAVGFTCFALSALWIRYEMTFDNFHQNAKNKYVVYRPYSNQAGYVSMTPIPLAAYLKETFPEIANATSWGRIYSQVTVESTDILANIISADSSFLGMFDVKVLEGSHEFIIPESKKLAITQEKARQLFGNEHPIGKIVSTTYDGEFTICAVVLGMSKQSNYPFDFIGTPNLLRTNQDWRSSGNTIIELFPKTNVEVFEKKLYEHHTGGERDNITKMIIIPLTKLRYIDPEMRRNVKFQHILIFAISGLLVVLCSLFNYLTLFVSRFRMRQKELALRVVCGASGGSLLLMLSVEFILTLLFAVGLGCVLTQLTYQSFLTLSEIKLNLSAIYLESLMYVGSLILVSLLAFWLILFLFRRKSLNLSFRRSNKNLSRKTSVIVQLVISTGFAFCTIIILKQMYFLHHTEDLGFSFKNRGSILVYGENNEVLANWLKQIPEITEAIDTRRAEPLLPQSSRRSREVASWDNKPANVENINLEYMYVTPESIAFYDFRLITGELLTDADPDSFVLINESAVKAFDWHDPIGKQFDGRYTVKGVIKNIYNYAPTIPVNPVFYLNSLQGETMQFGSTTINHGRYVMFKYREGMWKSCKEKIEQIEMDNDFIIFNMDNAEEKYDNYLKSENALIKLLSFVSAICILICVFGFVSLVSLTCEERRKEIAIRKINGATAGDILSMFAKEYFMLLIIGAVIAFTAGYFIMQRWLEHYMIRTGIPAWIYLAIIFVMALVITLCVGWQVYKSSVENPAEVVKSE